MEILTSDSSSSSQVNYSLSDEWGFGKYWNTIKPFAEQNFLDALIHKRQAEIIAIREAWRPLITSFQTHYHPTFYERLQACLQTGHLVLIKEGLGGTYFLKDSLENICFIVKPLDEEILCLNNRKALATPFNQKELRVRPDIPLYRSCQTSAAAFAIAHLAGLSDVTPETHLSILTSSLFYTLEESENKEKLCSVQEYLIHSTNLYATIQTCAAQGMTDIEIGNHIDQRDFERAMLFVWLCYDNDGHAGNFRTFLKPNGLFGLVKIDNNLTFPEKNNHLENCLSLFPNAEKPLSPETRALLHSLPIASIVDTLRFYGLEKTIDAFKERVALLQTLTTDPTITLKAINNHLLNVE